MASWFRSWHGAPTDNKWLVIARRANVAPGVVSAVAWALMDHASQADERGSVAGFDVETYCAFAGFPEQDVTAIMAALRDKGVIGADDRLTAWDKRQPKREDDSSDRVRNWRAEHAKPVTPQPEQPVTHGNAVKRNVTHGNNTDTDTDTEQRIEEKGETPPPPPTVSESATFAREQSTRLGRLNAQVAPALRTPIANVILDMTGKRALADAGGAESERVLAAAHEAAVTLYQMGVKSESALLALEPEWRDDWRGCNGGTAKQLLEFVSERQGGKQPSKRSNGNGRNDASRGFGLASLTTDADRAYHASIDDAAIAELQAEFDQHAAERRAREASAMS